MPRRLLTAMPVAESLAAGRSLVSELAIGPGPAIDFNNSPSKDGKISLTLPYIEEFDVKNRIECAPLMLNMSISF